MAAQRRGFVVEDLYRIKTLSDAQISPDGGRVAFVVTEVDRESDGYRSTIWLAEGDGSAVRPLTFGQRLDNQPRWSPDGRLLAFTSNRGGVMQVYLLPLDGGEPRLLTTIARGVSEFAWSPRGDSVAFTSKTGGMDQTSSGPRVITTLKHKHNALGFSLGARYHLFVQRLVGGPAVQITDGDWDDTQPDWSPDGRTLVFVSARHDSRDRDNVQDLWLVPVEGGEARCLTRSTGPVSAPAFSPDGRTVAYAGHDHVLDGGGHVSDLWTVAVASGEPDNLSATLDRSIQAGPALPGAVAAKLYWTADGSSVVARVHDRAAIHTYRFALGEDTRTVLCGGARTAVSLSVAADGRMAMVLSDLTHAPELYLSNADGSGERRLTSFNDDFHAQVELPEVSPIVVTAPDGAQVEGWVYKPLGQREGVRYPLVVDIHGGPHAAFMQQFRPLYPLALASLGCAVLQLNPRGSTGFGAGFARALFGRRGELDLAEHLAGVDQLIAEGWVDPERLGVTGYSYGGHMVAWTVTQTHRFKAAVMGAGTPNLYTHFAYSDMTLSRYPEMGGAPWENPALYHQLSPITHVASVRTPLLMLHGESDLRVQIAQAEEFFTALKYFGQEVELVRYPGENHELLSNGRPSNRVDYSQRLIAWFAERLNFSTKP